MIIKNLMSNPVKRIITSLLFAPIFLYVIYLGGYLFLSAMLLLYVLMFVEWIGMTRKLEKSLYWWLLGFLYITFAIGVMIFLEGIRHNIFGAENLPIDPFAIIILVWVNDIFSYIIGKSVGGAKLWPSVSPNKTWSGAIGGVAACLGVLFIINYIQDFGAGKVDDRGYYLIFAFHVLVPVVSQIGDLFISHLKRKASVKDTGNILPGHGGLLDRFDGLLLVLNVFGLYFYITIFLKALGNMN